MGMPYDDSKENLKNGFDGGKMHHTQKKKESRNTRKIE